MPGVESAGRTPVRGGWADMLWGTTALLVLLAGFTTVVEGVDWFVSTALVCVLVATATIVLRQLGARRVVAPIALIVEVVVLSWVFVPATLVVLIPTPATLTGFSDLIEQAGPIIAQEQAPVAASASIVLVLAAAFGALVVLLDLLIQQRQGVVVLGALLLAIYITPSLITGTSPSGVLFVMAAALWLIMLRRRTAVVRTSVGEPRRAARQVPALVLGVGGLVAALIFPAVSPNVSSVAASWGNPPPQVFGPGINPIVELGTNLRRNTPVPVMTLTTTLDEPPYLKVATLPNFTGRTWRPAENFNDGRFEEMAVRDGISADRAATQISVSKLRSDLLPVPYPTVDIGGLEGSYQVERTGLTVKLRGSDITGQTYTTESIDVQPTAEQLRGANPRVTPDLRRYTELEDAPPIIFDMATQVTEDATNNYDRAVALQNYFRSGEFDYSETAPVAEDYDGNGLTVIAEFLQRKAGYCVHFSSAMAVMARSLGIPARVAVGYAPGGLTGEFDGGRRVYEVMSDDLHAWTELYFDGVGWVRFDPTPGIGQGTAFSEPASDTPDSTLPESGVEDAQPQEQQQNPRSEDGALAPGQSEESTSTAPRSAVAVALALLAIVLLPGLARVLRRSWRLRQAEPDRVWREIEDTARDFGVLTSVADTPRGLARRLSVRPGIDSVALDRLLDLVERRRYSPATVSGDEAAGDARVVIDSLQEGAPRLERWRAALLPRSLGPRSAVAAPAPTPNPAT
ncbi:transglutaminase TgpA family protein [Aeromicrobium sp. CF3.5]|uniref:transglutaminase TgpA family protein n=1 Tax=Aeromicrobium sp. CF3.5 TaxID=3373078 RepID=UPI003EE4C9E6